MTPLAKALLRHISRDSPQPQEQVWCDFKRISDLRGEPLSQTEFNAAVEELVGYERVKRTGMDRVLEWLPEKPKEDPQRSLF